MCCCFSFANCNDEWTEEQYDKYLSFVNSGVNNIYLKYDAEGGLKPYKVPVLLGGSTFSNKDINVTVAIDKDTIADLNFDHFRYREDLYYQELDEKYYKIPSLNTVIKKDSTVGYIDVSFNFMGLDMIDKHMLALTIDPASELPANPRKYYKKTLMNIVLFNDFSGKYSVAGDIFEIDNSGNQIGSLIKVEDRNAFVIDENSVFFYAGFTDEEAIDRGIYRVQAEFTKNTDISGTVNLFCDNPNIKFDSDTRKCNFIIEEEMDALLPYLKRIYTTVYLEYTYDDITNPDYILRYKFKGNMILERKLNTLKPEEDQYIFD